MFNPFKKKKAKEVTCPHCAQPMPRVEWRSYCDGKVGVIACGNCFFVIGANVMQKGRTV